MKREQVYELIDNEREYQDTIRKNRENDIKNDSEKSISDFLLYIEYILNIAKNHIYQLNDKKAMECVRKIASLSMEAMESFDTPKREHYYKIGDEIIITKKPNLWSSDLNQNCPFNIDYPIKIQIKQLSEYHSNHINTIAMTCGDYGWDLTSLIEGNCIQK